MNKNELQSVMRRFGDTQEILAAAMKISRTTLNKKINEQGNAAFTQSEINFIRERYSLSPESVMAIFFN